MKYDYLNDPSFLKTIDEELVKEQYIKIILLNFATEKPIQEIQGRVKNGSYNLNGKSSCRRTAQFSMIADEDGDITNASNLISINKKVNIEIGYLNTTDKYTQYPIIWFPLGCYIITEAQVNRGKENITISVNLKDKMVMLNGECGGTLPAAATLSEYDIVNGQGLYETKKLTMVQLIKEIVNHYGNVPLSKIFVNDLDTRVKQVMMWAADVPLYLFGTDATSYRYSLDDDPLVPASEKKIFKYGDDVGFIYTDFTYPGQLNAGAGETVCGVLDKIVSVLGNFEYFFDLEGNFIFQEIKNNLNTSQATVELGKTINSDYLIDLSHGTSEYDFSDSKIVATFSNNPHFNNVKNDYMVWGMRKDAAGKSYPIRYHLAIDQKPVVEDSYYTVYIYTDEFGTKRAQIPYELSIDEQTGLFNPNPGTEGYLYIYEGGLYTWTMDKRMPYNPADPEADSSDTAGQMTYIETILPNKPNRGGVKNWYYREGRTIYKCIQESTDTSDCVYEETVNPYHRTTIHITEDSDWREILYLQGIVADHNGTDSNYYYSELVNEWPKMYDIENQTWICNKENLNFYLDFIDTMSPLGELGVNNIGRRSLVIDNKEINCLFENYIVDCILIKKGTSETDILTKECQQKGQRYCLVEDNIYDNLITGGSQNSAFVQIQDLLYQYTNYNETVAISILPMFHIEPNTRVTIQDTKTGIYGDYMINTISCSLDVSGMMNLSCTRILEKI